MPPQLEPEERRQFNNEIAPRLARQAGFTSRWGGDRSPRFAYFYNDHRLCIVAGKQEFGHVGKALAYGVTQRGGRALTLMLPEECAFSTLQRAPWFTEEIGLELWLHDANVGTRCGRRTRQDTIHEHYIGLKNDRTPGEEFTLSSTPAYLGERSKYLFELGEWATKDERLDPGHRQGERSWHFMGQKVLSIQWTKPRIDVRAGIHDKARRYGLTVELSDEVALEGSELDRVKAGVEEGIRERLDKGPNEHWLQAVVRQCPSIVGVEQPALRELPAWRPKASDLSEEKRNTRWGRGYVDIAGLDGHGNLRIVETKLVDNDDPLLVLQGLDYYIWSLALGRTLYERLGAPKDSKPELHYVIGDTEDGEIKHSPYTAALAQGLHPSVPWRFQTIRDWFHPEGGTEKVRSELFPPGVIPDED